MSDSFVTPWTIACQAPLSMGFSRQEYWSGLPFPSPGDLPDSGIKPACVSSVSHIGREFFRDQMRSGAFRVVQGIDGRQISYHCVSILIGKKKKHGDELVALETPRFLTWIPTLQQGARLQLQLHGNGTAFLNSANMRIKDL